MSVIEKVINRLILEDKFDCTSSITDQLRHDYAKTYAEITNGNFDSLFSSNRKYALKLAGLNLSKVLDSTLSGFVYCIINPAFKGFVKVGISKDVKGRLSVYQTYDPKRAYKIECYRFVEDKLKVERFLLEKYKTSSYSGEWIEDLGVIDYVRTLS